MTRCPAHLKLPVLKSVRAIPRERDERLVDLLSAKCGGMTWADAAAFAGINDGGNAHNAAKAVRDDDLAYSGKPPAVVLARYW